MFNIKDPSQPIPHDSSLEWLQTTAEHLVKDTIAPTTSNDPTFQLHRSLLHLGFLYFDLRSAIRWENGPDIISHWKLWLPRFLGLGMKNYANEAAQLISNVNADFPKHIAYIATHNRTVSVQGKPGHGKPADMMMEHYNL